MLANKFKTQTILLLGKADLETLIDMSENAIDQCSNRVTKLTSYGMLKSAHEVEAKSHKYETFLKLLYEVKNER